VCKRARRQTLGAADDPQVVIRETVTLLPATAETMRLMEAARENRLLIGRGGLDGNVIRISPPLNVSVADVDLFIRTLDASLAQVCAPALSETT